MSTGLGHRRNGDTERGGTGALARRGRGRQHDTGATELGHERERGGELGTVCK
jgi:hypothetical protein